MEEETTTPLAARPEDLHAEVAAEASHLEEVRQRHTFHLVTAGMLPRRTWPTSSRSDAWPGWSRNSTAARTLTASPCPWPGCTSTN